MASRSIDLISKKTNFYTCRTLFCLSLPLFCTTTRPFCTTKTSNFLVTHYFHEGIVVCAYQRFCLLCSYSLLFFHCRSFSPCWPLAFLIFSPTLWNIHVFLPTKFVSVIFNTHSSSFSVIHVSVNIKNNVEKGHGRQFDFLPMERRSSYVTLPW